MMGFMDSACNEAPAMCLGLGLSALPAGSCFWDQEQVFWIVCSAEAISGRSKVWMQLNRKGPAS